MALPKLEGIFTVENGSGTSSAWLAVLTETGGGGASGNIEIAAADYYLTSTGTGSDDLLGLLKTQLDAVGNATYTVTLDDSGGTEADTGKVTITASGGSVTSFALSFTDGAFRAALGFDGNLTGALTYTSENQAKYLWLPNCGRNSDVPDPVSTAKKFGRGHPDTVSSISPSGVGVSINYNTLYRAQLNFPNVTGKKTWQRLEGVGNESFEQFYDDVVKLGKNFRYHTDRTDDATYWTLWAPNQNRFPSGEFDPAWMDAASLHSINFEVLDYVS